MIETPENIYRTQAAILRRLGVKLHATGLDLPPNLSFEDWLAVGKALGEMERALAVLRKRQPVNARFIKRKLPAFRKERDGV